MTALPSKHYRERRKATEEEIRQKLAANRSEQNMWTSGFRNSARKWRQVGCPIKAFVK